MQRRAKLMQNWHESVDAQAHQRPSIAKSIAQQIPADTV
jgi:hypothetical protein